MIACDCGIVYVIGYLGGLASLPPLLILWWAVRELRRRGQ